VMGMASKEMAGMADGKSISAIVRQKLSWQTSKVYFCQPLAQ
jgi:hypothetical protein